MQVPNEYLEFADVLEGIELLCLINKSLDACRYLQTYGEWNDAIWLAKVSFLDGVLKDVCWIEAQHERCIFKGYADTGRGV